MQSTIYHRAILFFFLAIAVMPKIALAKEIKVDTGNVRVRTNSHGEISVKTVNSNLNLPRRRLWYPWRYWRVPSRYKHNSCRYTHQYNSHTSNSAGNTIYQHTTTSYCHYP